MSFKDVKYTSWKETFAKICKLISSEYQRHIDLKTSSKLNAYEKEQFTQIAKGNANPVDFESAFGTLCYPKFATCQKAKKWLDDNKIQYEPRDIKLDNPTLLELKNKLANMTEEEMLKLLATEIKSAKPLKQAPKSGW